MREFVRVFDDSFDGLVIAYFECLGDDGCYFAYDFPNSLAHRQFHRILTDILEQTSDSLIVGESSGGGEDVILKEDNGGMGNLGRKVAGLAFAKAEILFAVFENYFD